MNIVILSGRLGADPEIRFTQQNKAIATASLATTSRYQDKDSGEWKEKTEWHRIVEKRDGSAKYMKEHAVKGSEITIKGELTHRKYDDKGTTKYITEVVVTELEVHGRKASSAGSPPSGGNQEGEQAPGSNDQGGGYGPRAFGVIS